ncbi:DUF6036 family nucleotidyltransferase [Pedosphaera parvula]|uniref:DUF6036 family nucleotidyltransferase n=1 Tax=Pedosphaera parvula TaxID=1032527 RepID=UPI0003072735|nr:DUF6036 family nucleotidyltransferase [Pedosphaera parvula]
MKIEKWNPVVKWDSPAGQTLKLLAVALPKDRIFRITVFGSAPLQLSLDANFLSADVDIFAEEDLSQIIDRNQLGMGQRPIYIEQCVPSTFSAGPDWPLRSYIERLENVEFCLPHPIDILVSKLSRLEEKDVRAFRLVYGLTNEPTEDQLKEVLMNAVDLFRPRFDEERAVGDILLNTRRAWEILYGKTIDVRAEIVVPALERRRKGYGLDAGGLKEDLSKLNRDSQK